MGVVPQRERRPRTIVDYSFSGINQEAERGAPAEAMQFGKALNRILQRIVAANPRCGPTYMLKLDLYDGFYRVRLHAEDIPTLGVAFPVGPGEDPLVALPLTLPMGSTESPPYFCSATETAVDLINLHASPSGIHHGIPWNGRLGPSLHMMVGTASPSQHPRFRHHLDSRRLHNSHRPSNAIIAGHYPTVTFSSMTKSYWRRAPLLSYTVSNAKPSTSTTGSSVPTTLTTIQQSARSPSPKASCSRGTPAGPPPRWSSVGPWTPSGARLNCRHTGNCTCTTSLLKPCNASVSAYRRGNGCWGNSGA